MLTLKAWFVDKAILQSPLYICYLKKKHFVVVFYNDITSWPLDEQNIMSTKAALINEYMQRSAILHLVYRYLHALYLYQEREFYLYNCLI